MVPGRHSLTNRAALYRGAINAQDLYISPESTTIRPSAAGTRPSGTSDPPGIQLGKLTLGEDFGVLVRKGGLEPPCPCERSHLKAVRLPISPLPLVSPDLEKTNSNTYLKLVRLPSPPPPQARVKTVIISSPARVWPEPRSSSDGVAAPRRCRCPHSSSQ
jgi:hypothetical protein